MLRDTSTVLVGYEYSGAYQLPPTHPLRPWLPDAPPVMRLPPDEAEDDATSVFAGRVRWTPGTFDDLVLQVADDRIRFMALNWDSGAVYAPYDGGADLFWPTVVERELAQQKFDPWRSVRADGL